MKLGEEIRKYREKKGYSVPKLAGLMGINKQSIYKWEEGEYEPSQDNLNLLSEHLGVNFTPFGVQESHEVYQTQKIDKSDVKEIPFFDAIAVAGMALYVDETPISRPSATINPGTLFKFASASMRVYGDSMFPKYQAGCMIALREIMDKEEIVYGEDYVIETAEQRVLKRIMKSDKGDDFVELTSINPQVDNRGRPIYAAKDVHLSKIRRVYKVLGQVRYEMGGD